MPSCPYDTLDEIGACGDFYLSAISAWWYLPRENDEQFCRLVRKLWGFRFREEVKNKTLEFFHQNVPEEFHSECEKHVHVLFNTGKFNPDIYGSNQRR
jgi:hypothetical protein